ncbi:hypothetical protein SAMN04489760_11025 [Syntrophus gentianae]|uniref:Glycosyl transferase family 2 n=1 Tax=Syntrophus gentianae TaxID=43775 RepID=A0A1H7XDI3_9BACT|nr:hypothetical protein [Syntrophus gentianae]SEM31247.1 hypothetical protein SAMN04489760_11025 [Syntrophus gentianae]
MNLPRAVSDYLKKCRYDASPPLNPGENSLRGIAQVVVIPALAERRYLFSTLASLACNAPEELERTLVICVVNNRPYPYTSRDSLQNNRQTLDIIQELTGGKMPSLADGDLSVKEACRQILQGGLRLAYLDASSPGREMPRKQGGVGLARKLGLDAGLTVMDYGSPRAGRLLCLDADSRVEKNYLSAVRRFYETHENLSAVIAYAHPLPEDPQLLAAIVRYEIFLRYYELGLSFAESPYAFHTIGSTMSCTVRGYVAVRGMNRREAGEDFYFLNKLTKLSSMGKISTTRVYPSPRPSQRVPFGTGQRMRDSLNGTSREDIFYNPQVFSILKAWLTGMKRCIEEGGNFTLSMAREISPLLSTFLEQNDFPHVWERISRTHRGPEKRFAHFSEWFDAFRTMKLIHYLTTTAYPALGMGSALPSLLKWTGMPLEDPIEESLAGRIPSFETQVEILQNLRRFDFLGEG